MCIRAGKKSLVPMNPLAPEPEARDQPRTIRLILEYDGANFAGWQIQADVRTVQGELARALRIFLKEPVCPVGSGRTDAAVHALAQVAHFHTRTDHPPRRIQQALNGLLPPDIAVLAVEEAAPDFHARYSASSKRYRYRIRTTRSALDRTRVWSLYQSLDLEPMRAACRTLLGTHSFAAFCKQDPVPNNFNCHIIDCSWQCQGYERVFEIEANRFLRHMVRIIVGTLVEIGRGRRPPEDIASLLARGDRARAGPTAPAQGLCLVCVSYPESG